jgi:hypothetical protein
MSRFAAIARGTRALKRVPFTIWETTVEVALRPLNAMEEGEAFAGARAYAVGKGVPDPKPGERLYDLGLMVETLARGCVDADAPTAPFFASAVEILEHLDTDRIALLFEQHQAWQDECAPRPKEMGGEEFLALVLRAAEDESNGAESPFSTLQPVLRASSERTLARLYVNLLQHRSRSGLPADTGSKRTSDAPAEPEPVVEVGDEGESADSPLASSEADAPEDGDPEPGPDT